MWLRPLGALEGAPTPLPSNITPGCPKGEGLPHQECPGLGAPDGLHQSNGQSWEPAVSGQQTHLVWALKPWSLPERRPHQLPAAGPWSARCFVSQDQVGGSASQQEVTSWSPHIGFSAREGASRPFPHSCHENCPAGAARGPHPCSGKERSLPL